MNYEDFNETTTLLDELSSPEGYVFDCGIGCTYSADPSTFSKLKQMLGLTLNLEKLMAFERGETFRLFVQQGKSEIVHNAVKAVNPSRGVLHAKVYAMKYTAVAGSGKPLYRVVVASGNLTDSNELNICATFDSEDLPKVTAEEASEEALENEFAFGAAVSEFFKKHFSSDKKARRTVSPLPEKVKALLDELPRVDFGTDAEFLDVTSEELLHFSLGRMSHDARRATAVSIFSPFLSESFFVKLNTVLKLPENRENTLISRADQMDACGSKALHRFACYTLGDPDVIDADSPDQFDTLHAKIYLFYCGDENGGYTATYFGSANATEAAFKKNIEVLVRFQDKGNKCVIPSQDSIFCAYTPPTQPQAPDDEALTLFHAACGRLVASFQAEKTQYFISFPKKNDRYCYDGILPGSKRRDWVPLSVTLENFPEPKDAGEQLLWDRTNPYPHRVTLKIWDDQGHEETVPLLVDGIEQDGKPVLLNISDTELRRTIQQTIIKRLFRNEQSTGDGGNHTRKNAAAPKAATREKGLVERLSCLDDEQEIRKVCERIHGLLNNLPSDDPIRPILEAFCKACETSCPINHCESAPQNEQKGDDGNE